MAKTVLVLGATGGVGGETARALLRHGWTVRGLARHVLERPGVEIEWTQGDAMDRDAVVRAAEGADAILHAVNPPGYRDWGRLVLPMLDNSIAAALANGARLALPGTIYNYDVRCTPVAHPDSLQRPNTRKGAIRAEMERRLRETPGLRALVLRAGDFFGPRTTGNSWLSGGMVTPGKPVSRLLYPGDLRIGHAWAYLPDMGEAFARLLDREARLPNFACHHLAGHWADGAGFVAAIGEAVGVRPKVRAMPWRLLPLVAPFNQTMREMVEMESFWRHPLRLDNASLEAEIGPEPRTPLVQALRTTLASMGCLNDPVTARDGAFA